MNVEAEAQIETVFHLTGRGLVLVLRESFNGKIIGGGTITSDRGSSAFVGPEFLDPVVRFASSQPIHWQKFTSLQEIG